MKRPRWYSILFVLVVGVMAVQAVRLLRADSPTTPRPIDVANAARVIAPGAAGDERERGAPTSAVAAGNGVVEPASPEVRIGAPVGGAIAKLHVVEGQRVEVGAPLVELDRRVEAAALAAAEANVLAARAELERSIRGTRAEDIRAARAEADGARARAALARDVAARVGKAAAAGALTGDELARVQREAEAADAAARGAVAREEAAVAGSRREEIQVARARLAGAEAQRDQAAAIHARLLVVAPAAGEILQLGYRAGELYQPEGEPLAVLGDTSRLRVRLDLDERDVGKVARGTLAVVRANAFPTEFRGTVVEVGRRMGRKNVRTDDPVERNDTKILEVVIALDPGPSPLVVGQRVTGYLLGK